MRTALAWGVLLSAGAMLAHVARWAARIARRLSIVRDGRVDRGADPIRVAASTLILMVIAVAAWRRIGAR